MKVIIEKQKSSYQTELRELNYGTIITEVKGHPDSVYIKVEKNKGKGLVFIGPMTIVCFLISRLDKLER